MSEPSKAGDGSLERLREEATDDVKNVQLDVADKVAEKASDHQDDAKSD